MLSALLSLMPLLTAALPSPPPTDYFATNGFGKPVSTMQHPCAEYWNGVTYIAYQGPREDPWVCSYDHAAKHWSGPFQAGTSALGKAAEASDQDDVDQHGRPALIVDGDGYIHVIFGGHGGAWTLGDNPLGTPGGGRQMHAVTTKPGDVSAWQILDNIPPSGTYSQFAKMPDGDIYLFYRHGSHRSDWVYQKSTDNARTFAPPVSVLKHKPQAANPNVHDAWYAWFQEGAGDTITVTFNFHPCAVLGHGKARYNGYYMKMDCATDSWENCSGKPMTLPLTKEAADLDALVCNTGEEGVRTGICRTGPDGNPHVFYRFGGGQIRYSRWTGKSWQAPAVVTRGSKSQDADFLLESPESIRMLLSQSVDGTGEVGWWKSGNGGLDWTKDKTLISAAGRTYLISALVRNGRPDARAIISEIDPAAPVLSRKMFLFGDDGPVPR